MGSVRKNGLRARNLLVLCIFVLTIPQHVLAGTVRSRQTASPSCATPLRFRANSSPTDAQLKYIARGPVYDIFLASAEADVVLHRAPNPSVPLVRGKMIVVQAYAHVLRMRFANANPPTQIVPLERSASAARISSPETFRSVAYRGIYPGVDIVFHGDQKGIAIDLALSAGADPASIVLKLDGATQIHLDRAGNAVISAGKDSIQLERPSIFDNRSALRRTVSGSYRIESGNRLRVVFVWPAFGERTIAD